MSEAGIIAIVTAILTFTASIYSAARVSHDNRDKTIRAVSDEIKKIREELKTEIQSVRDDVIADRMDSKAADEEMHAELLLFKQESMAAFDKQVAATSAAMDKGLSVYAAKTDAAISDLTREVREHNNFARRVPVIEQRLDNVERRLDKM